MKGQDIDELNQRFEAAGGVIFEKGLGGLARALVRSEHAEAHIYLHGAHLTHYQARGQKPLLFLSPKSFFEDGKAIRGGVPVIFPWFGPLNGDKSKMHGFVRLREWEVESCERDASGAVRLGLSISSNAQTRAIWPHDFALRFTATVGKTLTMKLEVRNTSDAAFEFDEGLHTYIAVADVRQTTVRGLKGAQFRDRNVTEEFAPDSADAVTFPGRTDRMYIGTGATCNIDDPGNTRRISVAKENSRTTVVWNPGKITPSDFADLDVGDWHKFVCVETCNVRADAVRLAAGAMHTMRAIIEATA